MTTNLKSALESGVVTFSFKKVNGEVRKAVGTMNREVLEREGATVKGTGVAPAVAITFWDMEKKAWRAVSSEKAVVSIDEVKQA